MYDPIDHPQRYLVLDRTDADDPKWYILTAVDPDDVLGAEVDPATGRYRRWHHVCAWVQQRVGGDIRLTPVPRSSAWRIERGGAS